jgi:long-chain acyl-CoA synthetase
LNARADAILYGIHSTERALAVTQITQSGALVGFLRCLVEGATAVLLRTFDAGAALDAIERHRCTNCFVLPALLQLMAQEQAEHPRNLSSLRKVWVSGDSVPVMLQRQVWELFAVEVLEVYGMTEVLPIAGNPLGAVRLGSLGLPVSSTVRIVDAQGRDVEADVVGEMLVRSPANCVGYWNDTKATAHLLEDGWLRTGDLGSRDEDGYLWFRGRLKQIIVRAGSNISPR